MRNTITTYTTYTAYNIYCLQKAKENYKYYGQAAN